MSDAERDDEPETIEAPAPSEDSSLPPEDDDVAIEGERVDVDEAEQDGFGPPGGG